MNGKVREDWNEYTKVRNEYNKMIESKKSNHVKNEIGNAANDHINTKNKKY